MWDVNLFFSNFLLTLSFLNNYFKEVFKFNFSLKVLLPTEFENIQALKILQEN